MSIESTVWSHIFPVFSVRLIRERLSKQKTPASETACGQPVVFLKSNRMSVRGQRAKKVISFDLDSYLQESCAAVNAALDRFLPKAKARPSTIHTAMRYSLFAGGKRLRPVLCLAAAEACGG